MFAFRSSSALLLRRSTTLPSCSLFPSTLSPPSCLHRSDDATQHQNPQACRTLKTWSRKQKLRQKIQASLLRQHEPTLSEAARLPLSYQAMDNGTLTVLGNMGNHGANKEILKRHIMQVDGIAYRDTEVIYQQIAKKNEQHMFLLALPYQVGIVSALSFGVLSIPMVFHKETAKWFNHAYVTTDVPEPADLETFWEVGAWTWTWMEPAIGTVSFLLLALQFSRAQIQNLGVSPYTKRIKQWRAERLAAAFPTYDTAVVMAYSKSATIRKTSNPGVLN